MAHLHRLDLAYASIGSVLCVLFTASTLPSWGDGIIVWFLCLLAYCAGRYAHR